MNERKGKKDERAKPERHYITTGKEKERWDNNYEEKKKKQKKREDGRDRRGIGSECRNAKKIQVLPTSYQATPRTSSEETGLRKYTYFVLEEIVKKESVKRVKKIQI